MCGLYALKMEHRFYNACVRMHDRLVRAKEFIDKADSFCSQNNTAFLFAATVSAALVGGFLIYDANQRDIEIEKMKDYNKDGIEDIMIDAKNDGATKEKYLFLGQKDGKYLKLKEFSNDDIKYFMGDDNVKYVWNGEAYQKLPR